MTESHSENNPLKAYRKFRTTKKTLSDFVDSFDKLNKLLEQKLMKEKFDKRILNDRTLSTRGRIEHSENNKLVNDSYNSLKNEKKTLTLKGNEQKGSTEMKKDNIHTQKKGHFENGSIQQKTVQKESFKLKMIGNSNTFDDMNQTQSETFTLPDDLKKLYISLQSGTYQYLNAEELSEIYENIEFHFKNIQKSLVIQTSNEVKTDLQIDQNIEIQKMEELRKLDNLKKLLRKQMAKEFLKALSTRHVLLRNAQIQKYQTNKKNDTSDEKNSKNYSSIEIVHKFIPFFTYDEIDYLFIKYLIYRKNKLLKILLNTKCNFFIIEEVIRKEVTMAIEWFGMNIFLIYMPNQQMLVQDGKEFVDQNNSGFKTINCYDYGNTNCKSLIMFKNFIFSLFRKKLNDFHNEEVLKSLNEKRNEIKILTEQIVNDYKNVQERNSLIAKMIFTEIMKEMRDTKLAKDGILEL